MAISEIDSDDSDLNNTDDDDTTTTEDTDDDDTDQDAVDTQQNFQPIETKDKRPLLTAGNSANVRMYKSPKHELGTLYLYSCSNWPCTVIYTYRSTTSSNSRSFSVYMAVNIGSNYK